MHQAFAYVMSLNPLLNSPSQVVCHPPHDFTDEGIKALTLKFLSA